MTRATAVLNRRLCLHRTSALASGRCCCALACLAQPPTGRHGSSGLLSAQRRLLPAHHHPHSLSAGSQTSYSYSSPCTSIASLPRPPSSGALRAVLLSATECATVISGALVGMANAFERCGQTTLGISPALAERFVEVSVSPLRVELVPHLSRICPPSLVLTEPESSPPHASTRGRMEPAALSLFSTWRLSGRAVRWRRRSTRHSSRCV